MADLDRVIQSLYTAAIEDDWQSFRPHALRILCEWTGAVSVSWHSYSSTALSGSFIEYPKPTGMNSKQLLGLEMPKGNHHLSMEELPAKLVDTTIPQAQSGYAVHYSHRGGAELVSTILLRFTAGKQLKDNATINRALSHMVEASTLALRHFIQRDEWLHNLGRPSRGAAAMVDEHGAIYAASQRFMNLLTENYGNSHFTMLPCALPREALETNGSFMNGSLHFRVTRDGPLYILHLRRSLPLDGLSPREREIARALGSGKTFKTVARQYGIAVSTVANHASRIYKKLGIYRREELIEQVRTPAESAPAAPTQVED
ncbi:MAG: helix-turn-helix transcriptional regulator [Pseudomonadota bacterium]